jgi:hypothetical protein
VRARDGVSTSSRSSRRSNLRHSYVLPSAAEFGQATDALVGAALLDPHLGNGWARVVAQALQAGAVGGVDAHRRIQRAPHRGRSSPCRAHEQSVPSPAQRRSSGRRPQRVDTLRPSRNGDPGCTCMALAIRTAAGQEGIVVTTAARTLWGCDLVGDSRPTWRRSARWPARGCTRSLPSARFR